MKFNENQLKAINFYNGNCNVIATAGSGKTGCLTNRIKNLIEVHGVRPDNILAITFSKKAKESMVKRLSSLIPRQCSAVNVETFHSLGYRIIRKNTCSQLTILSDFSKFKLLDDINSLDIDLKLAISTISSKKNQLSFPNYNSANPYDIIYCQYEEEKKFRNVLDFDDMLTQAYELLSKNPPILESCVSRYQFILVDEAQDMNRAQYEIIKLLGKKNNNVFIVNDPLQNIYEWRGSNNKFVLEFHKDWDNVTVINLATNYRSTQDIVDFSNNFAKTIADSQHNFYVESNSNRATYKQPAFSMYENEFAEADGVVNKIRELLTSGQYSYKDFCILSRTNAQLQTFESVMYKGGLPYQIVDGISLVERKETKIVLSYLKLSLDLNDNESFEYVYNKPNRYLGSAFLTMCKASQMRSLYCSMFSVKNKNSRYTTGVNELCSVINTLRDKEWKNVKEQIKYLRKKLNIDTYVSGDVQDDSADNGKVENLDSLEQIAAAFKTTSEFIAHIKGLSKKNNGCNNDHIKLSTIHRSKGLEFPVVFLIGLNDGLLPHYLNENTEEEKRLVYVAITRAEKELYYSSVRQYQGKTSEISPFIADLSRKNNTTQKERT